MINLEYANRVFTPLRTFWDRNPDKCPNDYDQTVPSPRNGFTSKEEEEDYWDKMIEMELDLINW